MGILGSVIVDLLWFVLHIKITTRDSVIRLYRQCIPACRTSATSNVRYKVSSTLQHAFILASLYIASVGQSEELCFSHPSVLLTYVIVDVDNAGSALPSLIPQGGYSLL